MSSSRVPSHPCRTDEYWANVSTTARDFVSACLTVNPTQRPTATEMLQHRWLADEKPHFVPDPESPTGGPRDLLPHIQKRLDAKARCVFLRLCTFIIVILTQFLAVRRAVWGITAMKRMSTLASLASNSTGELEANIAKYKEESEKEDVNEVRLSFTRFRASPNANWQDHEIMHHHNQGEQEETVDDGAQKGADLVSTMRNMTVEDT